MSEQAPHKSFSETDLKDLKERMKLIADADPNQYHNELSLKRFLRAFKTTDAAFQAILKTNKWRNEYNVASLTEDNPVVKKHMETNKARVLRHRDIVGRPVIYIPAKNHNVNDRDIDDLTKFIVYCLVVGVLSEDGWMRTHQAKLCSLIVKKNCASILYLTFYQMTFRICNIQSHNTSSFYVGL
ncbi:uncharacterized protein LOC110832090 isoform X2 [Zootermopsis nevadensis]|uniref:uncharacterized protein LOC110832090 isoform X2 n=1 Tax=Zootermopsis nevadensis TaxID=136037 RepID=UPI000B8E34A0|nr:uncharacterized protein LOC110832090 isoform X2 [Zootermopsis nevadensis]